MSTLNIVLGFEQLPNDPSTMLAGILGDLVSGGAERAADDVEPDCWS